MESTPVGNDLENHDDLGLDNVELPFPLDLDEEGILNILTEAIGQDVGTDLFREFAQSNSFHDVFEIVNSALAGQQAAPAASAPMDLESSTQKTSELPTDETIGADAEKLNVQSPVREPVKTCPKSEQPDHDLSERNPKTSTLESCKLQAGPNAKVGPIVQTEEAEIVAGSFEESIKVMDIIPSHTKPKNKKGGKEAADARVEDKSAANAKLKDQNNDPLKSAKPGQSTSAHKSEKKLKSEKDKKRKVVKIKLPNMGADGLKYKRHNLKQCSVIVCDLLELGTMFDSLKTSKSKSIIVERSKMKEIHRSEKVKRLHFKKKLKVLLAERKLTEADSGKKHSKGDNSKAFKTTDEKRIDGKKRRKLTGENEADRAGSDSSNDCKEVERHKKRKEKVEKFSAGGTRILPFEKGFDNRERIKRPKMKEAKPEKPKVVKESKSSLQIQAELDRQKFATTTFRIPKKPELPNRHTQPFRPHDSRVVSSTPLARHAEAEQMKFERRRKFEQQVQLEDQMRARGRIGETEEDEFVPIKAPPCNDVELPDDLSGGGGGFEDQDDDDAEEVVPPPVDEVKLGQVGIVVAKLLTRSIEDLHMVEESKSLAESTAFKCALWFRGTEADPVTPVPYNAEFEDNALALCLDDCASEVSSFFGNVSNPDGVEDTQINIVSSSNDTAPDEYRGCSLLAAKYRTTPEGDFKNIFFLRPGTNYEKENFQAKCNLCDKPITGRKELADHVTSPTHRDNLQQLSLNIVVTSTTVMPKQEGSSDIASRNDRADKPTRSESSWEKNRKSRGEEMEHMDDSRNGTSRSKVGTSYSRPNRSDVIELVSRDPNNKSISLAPSIRSGGSTVPPGTEKPLKTSVRSRSPRRNRSRSPRRRSRSLRRRSRSPAGRKPHRSSHRSRSRSNHRGQRARSRSPHPKPLDTSVRIKDPVEEFLERTNRPLRRSRSPLNSRLPSKRPRRSRSRSPNMVPELKRKANEIFNEKLALTIQGKWTAEMEVNFKRMEAAEEELVKEFEGIRRQLSDKPEDHPMYSGEWEKYWAKKYGEIETSGGDPEAYDYVPEWKAHWAKRVEVLFDVDYSTKLEALRLEFGMDFESLRKLKLGQETTASPGPGPTVAMPVKQLTPVSQPTPVPLAVNPVAPMLSSLNDEDCTARSMSISDGGSIPGDGKSSGPPKPAVTADDVKTIWEMMTGQKMSAQVDKTDVGSIASSGSSAMPDGLDLVQILRLMQGQEDQLSLLAPQVKSYFQKAEELELSKSKSSYNLLEDKIFVNLLFKCRNKFNSLINSGVLQPDVSKALNLCVYSLNLVLDLPKCKRFRPKTSAPESVGAILTSALDEAPKPSTVLPIASLPPKQANFPKLTQNKPLPKQRVLVDLNFSDGQMIAMADLISTQLNLTCRNTITKEDLEDYVWEAVQPATAEERAILDKANSQALQPFPLEEVRGSQGTALRNFLTSSELKQEDESKPIQWLSGDEQLIPRRAIGTALPVLQTITVRAASPPLPPPSSGPSRGVHNQPVCSGRFESDIYLSQQPGLNTRSSPNFSFQVYPEPPSETFLHMEERGNLNPGSQELTGRADQESFNSTPPVQATPLESEATPPSERLEAIQDKENEIEEHWKEPHQTKFTLPFTVDENSCLSSVSDDLPELPTSLPAGIRALISKDRRMPHRPHVYIEESLTQGPSKKPQLKKPPKKKKRKRSNRTDCESIISAQSQDSWGTRQGRPRKPVNRTARRRRKKKSDTSVTGEEVQSFESAKGINKTGKHKRKNVSRSRRDDTSDMHKLNRKPKHKHRKHSESPRRIQDKSRTHRRGSRAKSSKISRKRKKLTRSTSPGVASVQNDSSEVLEKEKLCAVAQDFWENDDSSISSAPLDEPGKPERSASNSRDRIYRNNPGIRRISGASQVSDAESGEILSEEDEESCSDDSGPRAYIDYRHVGLTSGKGKKPTVQPKLLNCSAGSRKYSTSVSPREETNSTLEDRNPDSSLVAISDPESGEL